MQTEPPTLLVQPVSGSARIESLDVIRGVAVLGILLMNVQSFSMPSLAYFNPQMYGDLTGVNGAVQWVGDWLARGKFITLFAILFGYGLVLLSDRIEMRGDSSTGILLRRLGILLVIGFVHAYALWYGDILHGYAICGLAAMWLRRLSATTLVSIGAGLFAVGFVVSLGLGALLDAMIQQGGVSFDEIVGGAADIEKELAGYTGSWSEQFAVRWPLALEYHTLGLVFFTLPINGSLILMGMALAKWRVFEPGGIPSPAALWVALSLVIGLLGSAGRLG